MNQRKTFFQFVIPSVMAFALSGVYTIVDGFTGMGISSVAMGLSMWRKTVFLAGVFLIPRFAGITNVFYTEPLSDFLGTVVSVLMFCLVFKRVVGNPHERKETVA